MKKISTPIVILLSLATLGVYTIIWFALRRKELEQTYEVKVPGSAWLVTSAVFLLLGTLSTLAVSVLHTLGVVDSFKFIIALVLSLLLFVAAFVVGLVWIIGSGAVFSNITAARVPLWWSIVFYVFIYTFMIPVYQYYINKLPAKPTMPKKHVGPSRRFVAISAVAILLLFTVEVYSIATLPKDVADIKAMTTLSEKADKLYKEHATCIEQLNVAYPDETIAAEDEAAYMAEHGKCEEIRIKQNALVDRLNKLYR